MYWIAGNDLIGEYGKDKISCGFGRVPYKWSVHIKGVPDIILYVMLTS